MTKILYIGTETCVQCKALKRELDTHNVPYEMCNDYTKYDVMTVPTLVLVDDTGKSLKQLHGFHTAKQVKEWAGID